MNLSPQGLALVKQFEGCKLEAYQDGAGVWTIGYGHTGPDVLEGLKITQNEAGALLAADLKDAIDCVNGAVLPSITQNQFDALVDFTFNLGRGSLLSSTLLHKLNLGDSAGASRQFMLWVNVDGKRSDGLARRRQAEMDMFLRSSQGS